MSSSRLGWRWLALWGSALAGACADVPPVSQTPQAPQPTEVAPPPTAPSAAALRVGIRMRNHHDVRLYRGQQAGAYANTGVDVHFFTKGTEEDAKLSNGSQSRDAFVALRGTQSSNMLLGKVSQAELDAALAAKEVDCISTEVVGFLEGIAEGRPRRAVITLGRSSLESPSTELLIRTGFRADKPKDWTGARVAFTQANPIDRILIEELRRRVGAPAGALSYTAVSEFRDVVDDLRSGKVDLVMIPLKRSWRITMLVDSLIQTGVFRHGGTELSKVGGLDLNQQLLVCASDIVEHPGKRLVPFLEAYRSLVKVRDDPTEPDDATRTDATAQDDSSPEAAARKRAAEKVNHAGEPVDIARLEAVQQLMVRQDRLKALQPIAPWVSNPLLESTAAGAQAQQQ